VRLRAAVAMQPAGRAGVPSGLHTSSRHLGDSICLCARSLTLSAAPELRGIYLDGERGAALLIIRQARPLR